MKKAFASIVFLIIIVFWATQVFASGGETTHHGPDLKFAYVVINFVLLVILLRFFFKNPAKEFFNSRALKTKIAIENSKKLYDEAFRYFEEVKAKLNNADVEGKELLNSVKNQAEQEKLKIIAQAKETSEKIKSDALRIAEQEVVKAKQELKSEAVHLAADIAAQQIKEQITPETQIRLGSEFISQIKKGGMA